MEEDIKYFNRQSGWDDFKRESLEDNTMDAFEIEVIERVVEIRQLSLYLKQYIEEDDNADKLTKQITKLDSIIDTIDNFWND